MNYRGVLVALSLATVGLSVWSLQSGYVSIGYPELFQSLFGMREDEIALVVREVRLPRTLLAVLIGGILGLSGAVLQGFLRNPLAEPGLLGVSATASLGAVFAIYTGLAATYSLALPVMAQIGALLAVWLLHSLAGQKASILTLILAGVAISSLASALVSLILNLSGNPFATLEIVYWMLGSLKDRSLEHLTLAAPFILLGGWLLLRTGRALNALSLGEEVAQSLGVNLPRTRFYATVGTALGVGAATAVAGAIGFIGLIVPHLLRPLVGHHPARLLPASALGGACFLLLADGVSQRWFAESDLKLGVITALVGAPFFFSLLVKARRAEL